MSPVFLSFIYKTRAFVIGLTRVLAVFVETKRLILETLVSTEPVVRSSHFSFSAVFFIIWKAKSSSRMKCFFSRCLPIAFTLEKMLVENINMLEEIRFGEVAEISKTAWVAVFAVITKI